MKITYTRQQFIDYITPILGQAFRGISPGDFPEQRKAVQEAQEIIRLTLLEARELDPQLTNIKAQMYDAVTVIMEVLNMAKKDVTLRNALYGRPSDETSAMEIIMDFLEKINAPPRFNRNFECAEAAANPAHQCFNQCYVCRFPGERIQQPKPVQDGEG